MNNTITKKDFESLYNPKITCQRYDEIISKINDRFYEIVNVMLPNINKKGWIDYGNCGYGEDGHDGDFDIVEYKTEITVGGDYASLPEPYGCDNSFPTRWLWEADFKKEFDREVSKHKSVVEQKKLTLKQKRDALKEKKSKIWESVKQKLSSEEIKYIRLT
jgi:hypothetical protein